MNRQIAAASLLLALLGACTSLRAPSRQGLIAMEDHRCADAIALMQGPAAQGDGYSINNLGAILESGCPQAGWAADPVKAFTYYRNAAERGVPVAFSNAGALLEFGKVSRASEPDAAATLYLEGARYGDETSIKGLERLGRPVPVVDRFAPDIAERRQKQLDFAVLVAGVVVDRPSPHPQPRLTPVPVHIAARTTAPLIVPPQPVRVVAPARVPASPVVTPAPVSLAGNNTCRNTTDCKVGQSCVIPSGQVTGLGVCATPTEGGMAVIPAPRLMPVTIGACQFDTQCPTGFKCERISTADLNGLCVGPSNAPALLR